MVHNWNVGFSLLFFSTGIFTSIEAHLATQFLSIHGCLVWVAKGNEKTAFLKFVNAFQNRKSVIQSLFLETACKCLGWTFFCFPLADLSRISDLGWLTQYTVLLIFFFEQNMCFFPSRTVPFHQTFKSSGLHIIFYFVWNIQSFRIKIDLSLKNYCSKKFPNSSTLMLRCKANVKKYFKKY